jgi:hypothetical protein
LSEFCDDEDVFLGLVDFEKFENVGVVNAFEDLQLFLDALNVFISFNSPLL